MIHKERFIDRLRQKGWYWEILKVLWCTLLFFAFMLFCISADAQKTEYKTNNNYYVYKPHQNLPGWVGLLATPIAMTTVTIRDNQWKAQYGKRDPYMCGEKLNSYNKLMDSNNTIIVTGIVTSGVLLLVQGYINTKIQNKTHKRNYPCERYY